MSGVINTRRDAHHGTGEPDFDDRRRRLWDSRDRTGFGDDRNEAGRDGTSGARGCQGETRGGGPPPRAPPATRAPRDPALRGFPVLSPPPPGAPAARPPPESQAPKPRH